MRNVYGASGLPSISYGRGRRLGRRMYEYGGRAGAIMRAPVPIKENCCLQGRVFHHQDVP